MGVEARPHGLDPIGCHRRNWPMLSPFYLASLAVSCAMVWPFGQHSRCLQRAHLRIAHHSTPWTQPIESLRSRNFLCSDERGENCHWWIYWKMVLAVIDTYPDWTTWTAFRTVMRRGYPCSWDRYSRSGFCPIRCVLATIIADPNGFCADGDVHRCRRTRYYWSVIRRHGDCCCCRSDFASTASAMRAILHGDPFCWAAKSHDRCDRSRWHCHGHAHVHVWWNVWVIRPNSMPLCKRKVKW